VEIRGSEKKKPSWGGKKERLGGKNRKREWGLGWSLQSILQIIYLQKTKGKRDRAKNHKPKDRSGREKGFLKNKGVTKSKRVNLG